jgi:hypothetical protein
VDFGVYSVRLLNNSPTQEKFLPCVVKTFGDSFALLRE